MVTIPQLVSIFSRAAALISSGVVCAITGDFIHHLDELKMDHGSRIDYVLALSCISIFMSLVLMPPKRYSYLAFPFDGVMFLMWMVAFGLLVHVRIYTSSRRYIRLLIACYTS